MTLKLDGFLDTDEVECPGGVMEHYKRKFKGPAGASDGAWMQGDRNVPAVPRSAEQEAEWKRRILAIATHHVLRVFA